MQAPIKLLIPFEALADAIAVLDRDDQLRLRHILDQHLNQPQGNLDVFLPHEDVQHLLKKV